MRAVYFSSSNCISLALLLVTRLIAAQQPSRCMRDLSIHSGDFFFLSLSLHSVYIDLKIARGLIYFSLSRATRRDIIYEDAKGKNASLDTRHDTAHSTHTSEVYNSSFSVLVTILIAIKWMECTGIAPYCETSVQIFISELNVYPTVCLRVSFSRATFSL